MLPRFTRTLRRVGAAVLVCATVATVGVPAPVAAHSGLAAASPGPGQVVGGDVTSIQLFYGDLILEFEGSVTTPDGSVLASEATMLSDIEAVIELGAPITIPGEYAVRHTVLSIDGDRVEAAFLFTYDPNAPPAQLVFVEEEDDGGLSWFFWLSVVVGTLIIVVLVWQLWRSIRRRNAAHAE